MYIPLFSLTYFKLTEQKKKKNTIVSPPVEVEEAGAKKWENCLVGYFLDSKIPHAVVKSISLKLWSKHNLIDVIPIGEGFFIFKFSQQYGAKDVLDGGPWIIAGRYLVRHWWSTGLSLLIAPLNSLPVWVQFFGIPLELWTTEGLSHIASAVGVPLFADSMTKQGTRLKFARSCVEVDASKPLVEEFFLKLNGKGTGSSSPLPGKNN